MWFWCHFAWMWMFVLLLKRNGYYLSASFVTICVPFVNIETTLTVSLFHILYNITELVYDAPCTVSDQCGVANTECRDDGLGNDKCLCSSTHYESSSTCVLSKIINIITWANEGWWKNIDYPWLSSSPFITYSKFTNISFDSKIATK